MNNDDYKEIGLYGLVVTGATKAIHWLMKSFEEAQKHIKKINEEYNKERDEREEKNDDLYRGLSGVITEQNNKNDKIIGLLMELRDLLKTDKK